MKVIKTVFLAMALLFASSIKTETKTVTPHSSYKNLRWEICKVTSDHYRTKFGHKRDWNEFRIFIYSAYRVAEMFPMYPADSELDRMLLFYEFGQHETIWKKNFAVVNIPNATYKGGEMVVDRFSVDYTAWGLNHRNVKWTYDVAKRIQDGKPLPEWLPTKTRELLGEASIPKNIRLNKIDLSIAKKAKERYQYLARQGVSADKIRRSMKIEGYEEYTQDQIDSALIYRVIVEIDRKARGWDWGIAQYNRYSKKVDRSLYNKLKTRVDEYNYMVSLNNVKWNNMSLNPIEKSKENL